MTACPTPTKRAFPNSRDALKNALSLARGKGKAVRYYHCPCGKWHLTTKPRRERADD